MREGELVSAGPPRRDEGSIEARFAACREGGGGVVVPARPSCGSIERRPFRKSGSETRQDACLGWFGPCPNPPSGLPLR